MEAESTVRFDGLGAPDLAMRCGVALVSLHQDVPSTMDVAHALAERDAPPGTLVLADRQTAGRGRNGRAWQSVPAEGLTFTVVERPADERALTVLSLRLGMAVAPVLEPYATGRVMLKWPNDLYVDGGKLGGILVEVRWRQQHPDWVAIGIGVNVRRPALEGTAGLAPGASRVEILARVVPAVRAAVTRTGQLGADELAEFDGRDWARGRPVTQPAVGVARGVSPEGALLVETGAGIVACTAGSLVFAET